MLTRVLDRTARTLMPVFAAAALAAGAAAAEPVDISRLAPPRTFMVLSVPDFTRLRAGFEKSELGALWEEPGVKSFVERISEEQAASFGKFLKEFNAEADDLKAPTGAVGLAVFMPEPDAEHGEEDEEEGPPVPNLLLVADMGENADAWYDLIEKVLERAEREKEITTEQDKHGEATITTIKPVEAAGDEEDEEEGEAEEADTVLGGLLSGPLSEWAGLYLARSGTTLSLSTDLEALESALDALEGKRGEYVADAAVFKDATAQLPGGELGYGVIIFEPLLTLMREGMAESMPPEAAAAVLDGLGVSQLKAMSMGLRMDTADADTEMSYGVLAPEKKGLISLLAASAGPFEPPSFASADAAGVNRFSFKFSGLLGVIRTALEAMPEPQRGQALAAIDQSSNISQPALEALGPAAYVVSSYNRPLAHDSELSLLAIDVKDQVVISNTISFLASQAPGLLEPRDFDGNTIYTVQFPMMELGVGVGFGRLFIGGAAAVENAMRLAGRADAPRLADEPAFKDAVRLLGNDAVMYTFQDTAQIVRYAYWTFENQDKAYEAMLDEAGLDPEEKAEYLKEYRDAMPDWPKHLPPLESVLRHLGDSISEIRATPDGFRGRALMLRPRKE